MDAGPETWACIARCPNYRIKDKQILILNSDTQVPTESAFWLFKNCQLAAEVMIDMNNEKGAGSLC